jgi:hypothetical protein
MLFGRSGGLTRVYGKCVKSGSGRVIAYCSSTTSKACRIAGVILL